MSRGITARTYEPRDRERWNAFVDSSKNGTFLFRREYMDYHADRFLDASLVLEDGRGGIRALLPAAVRDGELSSHAGLTYGGFVLDERAGVADVGEIFARSLDHLADAGYARLLYKSIPHIYHSSPAEEDRYWLYRHDARLVRRDLLSVIDWRRVPDLHKRRQRSVRRARQAEVAVAWQDDYRPFWQVLIRNLRDRHHVLPVHTVEEIELLASRFPDRIRLAAAHIGRQLVAGAVVYVSPTVWHVQYNAASELGRETGALDAVLAWLTGESQQRARYFDFGISTEENGLLLNAGLVAYKEGFGGRSVVHDSYVLELGSRGRRVEPATRERGADGAAS